MAKTKLRIAIQIRHLFGIVKSKFCSTKYTRRSIFFVVEHSKHGVTKTSDKNSKRKGQCYRKIHIYANQNHISDLKIFILLKMNNNTYR